MLFYGGIIIRLGETGACRRDHFVIYFGFAVPKPNNETSIIIGLR